LSTLKNTTVVVENAAVVGLAPGFEHIKQFLKLQHEMYVAIWQPRRDSQKQANSKSRFPSADLWLFGGVRLNSVSIFFKKIDFVPLCKLLKTK
jgi:hypothetical protein